MTEIAKQEGYFSNLKTTFSKLWIATFTTISEISGGIVYGRTLDSRLASGMAKYMQENYKKKITTITKSNPTFSFFKSQVDNNYSGTYSYRIITTDGEKSGHTINVVGYKICIINAQPVNYLAVADGWYTTLQYFDMTHNAVVNSYGVTYQFN